MVGGWKEVGLWGRLFKGGGRRESGMLRRLDTGFRVLFREGILWCVLEHDLILSQIRFICTFSPSRAHSADATHYHHLPAFAAPVADLRVSGT